MPFCIRSNGVRMLKGRTRTIARLDAFVFWPAVKEEGEKKNKISVIKQLVFSLLDCCVFVLVAVILTCQPQTHDVYHGVGHQLIIN